MYRIIGSDGKEYGPVSIDQMREWLAQGRVNAQTQVLLEGTTTWRPLSDFSEFGLSAGGPALAPGGYAAPTGYAAPAPNAALQMVNGPATGLMVTAILGALTQVVSLVWGLAGAGMQMGSEVPAAWAHLFSGTVATVSSVVGILFSVVVLIGALKMKKLENHGFAIAASIIAAVPCVSPCCLLGLPIGIWAIVVLLKPEVKSAFH